jgi:protease-4
MLGTFISVFLLFFIFFVIIAGAISAAFSDLDKQNQVTKVENNSILHIELSGPITDRGPERDMDFNFGSFSSVSRLGLNQILSNIKKAKADDNIKGIYLDLSIVSGGMASVEEIRNELIDFKSDGKWIVAYSEVYSQKAYYLASVADEIYVYPEGGVDFRGLSTNIAFLKGMFDKLEIDMQVIRGSNNKFKSAVEPFMLDEMSQANRLQTEKWMGSLWDKMLIGIASSRNIPKDKLDEFANTYAIQTAQDAADKGLITAVKYGDEVVEILKDKVEIEKDKDLKLVTMGRYRRAPEPSKKDGETKTFVPSYKKAKIAVIYASGGISSGESRDEAIGSETFAEAIRDARTDTTVKAIVLRINSPGGSALASDVIWRETVLAKAEKPLIVSMGDVAASGGYYIAAAADRIYAQPNTITGSIGVFGVLPNMKEFFNNKMGITFDGVKTDQYADFGDVSRPLTDGEYLIIQKGVDQIYSQFTKIVSEGRNIPIEKVDSIGQGRVWSGTDALAIGLVDEIGGLDDAIAEAARRAGIEDYVQRDLPKRKDPFQEFLESFSAEMGARITAFQLGNDEALIKQFKQIKEIQEMKGIQARIPYNFIIE